MTPCDLTGLAQTVLGPVRPEELGPTMTHEHVLIDFTSILQPPEDPSNPGPAFEPVSMENLGWVSYNYFSNRDNLLLKDEETAIRELMLYKRAGGGTLVEASTIGLSRDPRGLRRIAKAAGVNIVMGAGFYVDDVHPDGMDERSESDLADQIAGEILSGVDGTDIRAGIIGEIGCSWPLTANERKVLRAAAAAQRRTGSAVLIHPGRNQDAPKEVLDVLAEAGADLGRVIMGHLDRTVVDLDALLAIAARGCYLEYDLFGLESSYYPLSDLDMPNDAQRLRFIRELVSEGYADRVVVGHDIYSKHRLTSYGGHGYAHFLGNVAPRMERKGFDREDIDAITTGNPARVLAFAPPS